MKLFFKLNEILFILIIILVLGRCFKIYIKVDISYLEEG